MSSSKRARTSPALPVLPTAVWAWIFSWLGFRARPSIARVCRSWKATADHPAALDTNVYPDCLEIPLHLFCKLRATYVDVDASECSHWIEKAVVLRNMSTLRQLRVAEWQSDQGIPWPATLEDLTLMHCDFDRPMPLPPALLHLQLGYDKWKTPGDKWKTLAPVAPTLQSLSQYGRFDSLPTDWSAFGQLTALRLIGSEWPSRDNFQLRAEHFRALPKQITTLCVWVAYSLDWSCLAHMSALDELTAVMKFKLGMPREETSNLCRMVADGTWPKLDALSICFLDYDVHEQQFEPDFFAPLKTASSLTSLHLAIMPLDTCSQSWPAALGQIPRLRRLEFDNCVMNEDTLQLLCDKRPPIECIEFSGMNEPVTFRALSLLPKLREIVIDRTMELAEWPKDVVVTVNRC